MKQIPSGKTSEAIVVQNFDPKVNGFDFRTEEGRQRLLQFFAFVHYFHSEPKASIQTEIEDESDIFEDNYWSDDDTDENGFRKLYGRIYKPSLLGIQFPNGAPWTPPDIE